MGDSPFPTRLRFEPIALYTVRQIAWATFLATPLAGGWMLRWNYLKLGNPRAARAAIVLSVAATAVLSALAFVVEFSPPRFIAALASVWVIRAVAQAQQGDAIAGHIADGGAILSNWRVARIVAVAVAGVFAAFAVISYASVAASEPDRVALGAVDIQYSGDATEADARRVGELLIAEGYVSESHRATILLDETYPDFTLSFVFGSDWGDDRLVAKVSDIAHRISTNLLAGRLTTVYLIDPKLVVRNTIHAPFVTPPSPLVDAVVAAVEHHDPAQCKAALAELEKSFDPDTLPPTERDRLWFALTRATESESVVAEEFAYSALSLAIASDRGFDALLRFASDNPADIGRAFTVIRGLKTAPQRAQIQATLALAANRELADEIALTALTWIDKSWLALADLAPQSAPLIERYRGLNAARVIGRSLGESEDGELKWEHERCVVFLALFAYLPRHEVVVLLDEAAKDANPDISSTAKTSLAHPDGAPAPN